MASKTAIQLFLIAGTTLFSTELARADVNVTFDGSHGWAVKSKHTENSLKDLHGDNCNIISAASGFWDRSVNPIRDRRILADEIECNDVSRRLLKCTIPSFNIQINITYLATEDTRRNTNLRDNFCGKANYYLYYGPKGIISNQFNITYSRTSWYEYDGKTFNYYRTTAPFTVMKRLLLKPRQKVRARVFGYEVSTKMYINFMSSRFLNNGYGEMMTIYFYEPQLVRFYDPESMKTITENWIDFWI